jgi:peptidoglycan/LPS O-acetylase OafA/YrhL
LFVILAVSVPLGWFLILPDDFRHFAQSMVATIVFLPNMFFARESGYFDVSSIYKPLLHTWSLGVEEQFYVLFPIMLFFIFKFVWKWRFVAILVAAILSIICAELGWRHNAAINFFLLPGRAWELLAGCLLALTPFDRLGAGVRRPMLFQILSLSGLASVCAAYVLFDSSTPSPSLAVLWPVVGAVLILACATPGTLCFSILSNRLATGIGLISYSTYLWHQPIFAFARMIFVADIPIWGYLALIGLTLGLAYLTWRFVENPFRDRKRFSRGAVFIAAAACMISFLAVGVSIQLRRGVPERFTGPYHLVAEGAADTSPLRDTCGNRIPASFKGFCVFGDANGPIVAILGDSHGKELFWRATKLMTGRSYALQPFLWNGCAPFASVTSVRPDKGCAIFHRKIQDYILGQAQIKTVVLVANWPVYLNCAQGWNCSTTPNRLDLSSRPADPTRLKVISDAMDHEIDAYRAAGKAVVLVYPEPQMPWDVPRFMLARLRASRAVDDVGVSRAAHEARVKTSRDFLDAEAAKPGVWAFDPASILCSEGANGLCRAQLNGRPLYFNFGHINGHGADFIAARLIEALDRLRPAPATR